MVNIYDFLVCFSVIFLKLYINNFVVYEFTEGHLEQRDTDLKYKHDMTKSYM